MKCFIALLFACTTSLAYAQAIVPAGHGPASVKLVEQVSQNQMRRLQRFTSFTSKHTQKNYGEVTPDNAHVFESIPAIEMNRLAGYALLYEKTGSEKMEEGRKQYHYYQRCWTARVAKERFIRAINMILQVNL